jgi:ribosomal protein S18 acetylase RimI-like enzyme
MNQAIQHAIDADLHAAAIVSTVVEQPWGVLCWDTDNPHYHDANAARRIRAADPDAAIDAITAFYRSHGLTPRVKVDPATQPADFAARLVERGYICDPSVTRVMVWNGDPPTPMLSPNIVLRRATAGDVQRIAEVQGAAFGNDEIDWIARHLAIEVRDGRVRLYVAEWDGVLAATAMIVVTPDVGMVTNVATDPPFQRRGLAAALIAQMQAEAREPLLLEVSEDNAERVYRRAGFEFQGELRQDICWLPNEERP